MAKRLSIAKIRIEDDGLIVLGDEELQSLESDFSAGPVAGGANDRCSNAGCAAGSSNTVCQNGGCHDDAVNTACVNSGCVGVYKVQ